MVSKLKILIENKNSSSIVLIDSEYSIKLVNYFNKCKIYFSDNESLTNIDFIISKINDFTNKNNLYITTHL